MTRPIKVDFDAPPLSEVVCGVLFKVLERFEISDYGLLWEEFAEEFPTTADQATLLRTDRLNENPGPRVWFLSEDETHLLQVQRDRFLFNWRKVRGEGTYPRFDAVYAAFTRHRGTFERFVAETGSPQLESLQLSYVNVVPMAGELSYGDYSAILKGLTWPSDGVSFDPQGFNWLLEGRAPHGSDNDKLTVLAQSGLRKEDDLPVLRLELTVRGPAPGRDLDEWFKGAHDSIVETFVDVTTEDAQQRWGRRR
ncbi:MAG: TIGR04255 family protein [Myxococcota bacterium]